MIGTYLAEIGLLRGEYDWVTEVFATFAPEAPHHYIETDVLLGLRSGIDDDLLALLPESGVGNEIRTLLACAQGDHDQADEARRIVDAWLAAPTLGTSDLLRFLLLLKIDAMIIDDGRASILPAENLRDPLENRFTWLAERALFRPMHHLLDLCEDRLPKKKREHWRAESNRIARSWTEEQQRRGEGSRVRIAMIGTIGVRSGSEEPEPIRGGRLKVLLGLLVGTEMLETPLSRDEFHRIASGESDDPNQARKKTNMAVIRLREALGADVIRVGEERHELIRDGVDVDLLQASDLLRTARTAFHSRSLLRAVPALLEALGIVGGEVPFPGLYDDFFESLRDDFELRIRTITLDICGALAAERDHARAEEILRVAYNTMPGDEEIAELLEQTLIALGKKAEATRVFSG